MRLASLDELLVRRAHRVDRLVPDVLVRFARAVAMRIQGLIADAVCGARGASRAACRALGLINDVARRNQENHCDGRDHFEAMPATSGRPAMGQEFMSCGQRPKARSSGQTRYVVGA